MMKIVIVEDEPLMAATLRHLIELNPLYSVIAVTDDLVSTLGAVAQQVPDLALVDLRLANNSEGLDVAARLHEMDIPCLLTTGSPPAVPVPGVALGCLSKPFDENTLMHALTEAEDIVRGRQKLVRIARLPEELVLYSDDPSALPAAPGSPAPATDDGSDYDSDDGSDAGLDAEGDPVLLLDEADALIDTSLLGRILATVRMPVHARRRIEA